MGPLLGGFIPLRDNGEGYESTLEDSGFVYQISGESVRAGLDVSTAKWSFHHEIPLQGLSGNFTLTPNPIDD